MYCSTYNNKEVPETNLTRGARDVYTEKQKMLKKWKNTGQDGKACRVCGSSESVCEDGYTTRCDLEIQCTIKIPTKSFTEMGKAIPKFTWKNKTSRELAHSGQMLEVSDCPVSRHITETERGRHHSKDTDLCRLMVENREPRNKPTQLQPLSVWHRCKENLMEKTQPLLPIETGKLEKHTQKGETRSLPFILSKSELKTHQ